MDIVDIKEQNRVYERKHLDVINILKSRLFYCYGPDLRVHHKEEYGYCNIRVTVPRFQPSKFWGRGWGKMEHKTVLKAWFSIRYSEYKDTLFVEVKQLEFNMLLEACLKTTEKELIEGNTILDKIRLEIQE